MGVEVVLPQEHRAREHLVERTSVSQPSSNGKSKAEDSTSTGANIRPVHIKRLPFSIPVVLYGSLVRLNRPEAPIGKPNEIGTGSLQLPCRAPSSHGTALQVRCEHIEKSWSRETERKQPI